MFTKAFVMLAAVIAAASAGIHSVAPAAYVAPALTSAAYIAPAVAPAAYIAPYSSSYTASAVNHAVAAPLVSAPYLAAAPYVAAKYVSAPVLLK